MFGHETARRQGCPVGSAVVEVDIDFVTKDLALKVPDHSMVVHIDDGIGLAQLQRVTDALHIVTEETHLIKSPQHPNRVVDRIGDNVVDERAQGIGMQVDGILLRELAGTGTSRHKAVMGVVIVIAVVAVEDDLVAGVGNHDIATGLTIVVLAVVIDRVAQQGLAILGCNHGALIERSIIGTGVVPAIGGIDGIAVAHDEGLARDVGDVVLGIVVQQVGKHLVAVVHQMNVARELGLLGIQLIAAIL